MTDRSKPVGFTVAGILAMAGGIPAVAKKLGLSAPAVHAWKDSIPKWHAREVAIMAGLPLAIVRPDLVKETAEQIQ